MRNVIQFFILILIIFSCKKPIEKEWVVIDLNPGEILNLTIKGGESKFFEIDLEANRYLHVQAIQQNIDLKLLLHLPNRDSTLTFDSPNGLLGEENIYYLTQYAGIYLIEVTPLSYYAEEGSFTIELKAKRPATPQNTEWMQAYESRRQADQLRAKTETRTESLVAYDAVIHQWEAIGDSLQLADAKRALGFTLRNMGQADSAIAVFSSLIPQWQKLGELRAEAFTYIILAGIYKNKQDYDKALDLTYQGIEKWKEAGDIVQETKAVSDAASFYMMTGDHEKAKTYYQKTIEMAKASGSLSIQGTMYRENGNAWQTFGNQDSVLAHYTHALETYQTMGHQPARAGIATLIGDFLSGKGLKKEARSYYREALEIWENLGNEGQVKAIKDKM